MERNLAFNLGGHINYSVFWPNMSPNGGDKPDGELAAAIDEHFGSFDAFRRHFAANALGVQGSGWSVLAWESLGQRPVLAQGQHDSRQGAAAVPGRRSPPMSSGAESRQGSSRPTPDQS